MPYREIKTEEDIEFVLLNWANKVRVSSEQKTQVLYSMFANIQEQGKRIKELESKIKCIKN